MTVILTLLAFVATFALLGVFAALCVIVNAIDKLSVGLASTRALMHEDRDAAVFAACSVADALRTSGTAPRGHR